MDDLAVAHCRGDVGVVVAVFVEQAPAGEDGLDRHEVIGEVDDDGLAGVERAHLEVLGRVGLAGAAHEPHTAQVGHAVADDVLHLGLVGIGHDHHHSVLLVFVGQRELLDNARDVFVKADDDHVVLLDDARLAALQLGDLILDAVEMVPMRKLVIKMPTKVTMVMTKR